MKPEVFVTLDPPLLGELIHDDSGRMPSVATVVLRHASGEVGFQVDSGCGAVIASFLGDCVMIERQNSPRWRIASASALTSADARYYARGYFACTHPQPALIEQLEGADRNRKIARQNEILARHGEPAVTSVPSPFDDWA